MMIPELKFEYIADVSNEYAYICVHRGEELSNPFMEIRINDDRSLDFIIYQSNKDVWISLEEMNLIVNKAQIFLKKAIRDNESEKKWDKWPDGLTHNAATMRKMTSREIAFINGLLKGTRWHERYASALANMWVNDIGDKGGSLRFRPNHANSSYDKVIAEYDFKDTDGVGVTAYLTVDNHDDLYELEIVKQSPSAVSVLPELK